MPERGNVLRNARTSKYLLAYARWSARWSRDHVKACSWSAKNAIVWSTFYLNLAELLVGI